MKSFSEFLMEFKIDIPKAKDTLGVERVDMPQIERGDMAEFLSFLKKRGGKSKHATVQANKLKPIQKQFSKAGVEKMLDKFVKNDTERTGPPILVSGDNFIIDGHHRWLARKNIGDKIKIVQITNMKVHELLDIAHDFPKTKYKRIGDNKTLARRK